MNRYSKKNKISFIPALLALIVAILIFFSNRNWIFAGIAFVSLTILFYVYISVRKKLIVLNNIKKMEEVFPDFIELVSSNLRSGMTVDKALLMSSRKEFYPLDGQILELGKDITTGKEISAALSDMGRRIRSDKINKTLSLIISGIKAGGNLAVLLEETASNLRERSFVEKRAASNVLMYVIFIFFAVSIGAPTLFALSSVLVKILTSLLANIPDVDTSTSLPFSLREINISPEFVTYFSLSFLAISGLLSSLLLGLINKGEEKAGIKYLAPIVLISLGVYFAVKLLLGKYFGAMFS